jgi:type IV pilus assembly protein PilW
MSTPTRLQRGFSLIELSVAILIALFLIGGVLVVEQGVHRAYADQSGIAQLQDEERFAMATLGAAIEEAGFLPRPDQNSPAAYLPTIGSSWAMAQGLYAPAGNSSAPVDSIYVRYASASGENIEQCDGTTNTSGGLVTYTSYFFVAADPVGNWDDLYCWVETGSTWGTAVPLVSNVTNLQIWYGINTTGLDNNVDTYLTAGQMTAANWMSVTTVMVELTFTNPLAKMPGQPSTVTFRRVIGVMKQTGVSS